MYRQPANPEEPRPPAEFLYEARERKAGFGFAKVQMLFIPLGLGALLAGTVSATVGAIGFVVSALAAYKWWRPQPERAILRLEGDRVHVRLPGQERSKVDLLLSELDDVVLDTKTVQRAIEGDSAIPVMRVIDAKPGFEIDEARIALVFANGRQQLLSEGYFPYTETTEMFGKLRVFFRKHGWKPIDERED